MPHENISHDSVQRHQSKKDGCAGMVDVLALDELLSSFEQGITRPSHLQSLMTVAYDLQTRLVLGTIIDSRSNEEDSEVLSGHQCNLRLRHYPRQYLRTEAPHDTNP